MTIAGTYDIVTKTPLGDQKGTFTIVVSGESFSGTVTASLLGSMPVTGGKVARNRLTWRMDMKVPMPMALDCEATVDGNTITGAVKAGAFGTFALNGVRAG